MEIRRRNTYASLRQKKKLIELVAQNPQLVSFKVSPEFTIRDSEVVWQEIAKACNAIGGSRKSWRQWKKTWQDLKSKYKKRIQQTGRLPSMASVLTTEEKEALGINDFVQDINEDFDDNTEIIFEQAENYDNAINESDGAEYLSEPVSGSESPVETKVFTNTHKIKKNSKPTKNDANHSNCGLNCGVIAEQEQQKMQIKKDYFNYKKDYLRQKLKLLKEQTEALKSIAKEFSDK